MISTDGLATPYCPQGWRVVEHRDSAWVGREPSALDLMVPPSHLPDDPDGFDVYLSLTDTPVLNADDLDHLLAHPELIPDSWKFNEDKSTRWIFFWGTIYCNEVGELVVRCLRYGYPDWTWDDYPVFEYFHDRTAVAAIEV